MRKLKEMRLLRTVAGVVVMVSPLFTLVYVGCGAETAATLIVVFAIGALLFGAFILGLCILPDS